MRKSITALFAAAALTASPVIAQTQAAPTELPARSAAQLEDANELRGGYILPLTGLIAALLIVLALTDTWPFDDDDPASP